MCTHWVSSGTKHLFKARVCLFCLGLALRCECSVCVFEQGTLKCLPYQQKRDTGRWSGVDKRWTDTLRDKQCKQWKHTLLQVFHTFPAYLATVCKHPYWSFTESYTRDSGATIACKLLFYTVYSSNMPWHTAHSITGCQTLWPGLTPQQSNSGLNMASLWSHPWTCCYVNVKSPGV